MKVLVTGGCGFLGSHVCEYYVRKGWSVISLDNMTKYELNRIGYVTDKARSYNWDFLKKLGVKLTKGDIRDKKELWKAGKNVDYIIHTAAQPAMTISWEDPDLDFSTNVIGTFNVLQLAKSLQVPIVSCASIHVYGNKINAELKEEKTRYTRNPEAINEDYPTMTGILTPLHASKKSAEYYVQAFIDTYKLKAASFRLTGIYGVRQLGGEDHGWVANFCIRAVLGYPLTIYGTGKQVRDIIYATDICKAFDAFYREQKPGIYNIGGGVLTRISLLECIDLIKEVSGIEPEVRFAQDRLGDLRYFVCDIAKAKKELHWEAKITVKKGLEKLIEWVRDSRELFTGN
ncbi:MAG: GDP-mannose 4,6-dehydratase [Candidatus Omnitrophica bacterium]|nr:GDP-mannose 4,6-dehydratase [Candidatus Omnitrophota bacterium]